MTRQSDTLFVKAALELAALGQQLCPNPPVGCIIVRDGQVIGRGYHRVAGHGHAEVNALPMLAGTLQALRCLSVLSLVPLSGRRLRAQTLIDAGAKRVVIGVEDPHPQVAGKGCQMLRDAGVDVRVLGLPEAEQMIAGFVSRILKKRPRVVLKSASSLDGAVALASGESQWITGQPARQVVQELRAQSDAVITGAGTVIADDPQLNVRDSKLLQGHLTQPLRVVLDSTLRASPDSQIFSDGTLVVHGLGAGARYSSPTPGDVEYMSLANGPRDLAGCFVDWPSAAATTCWLKLAQKFWAAFCNPVVRPPCGMNGCVLLHQRPWVVTVCQSQTLPLRNWLRRMLPK